MIITKTWAMPNKRTFQIKPIGKLLKKYIPNLTYFMDPFPFEYKEDAIDYLKKIQDNSVNYAVFDPPYSPRQLKECYKGKGNYDTKSSTWSNWKDIMTSKMQENGIVISFGWNSTGFGKSRGFKIIEILLVAHGGMHNDTICTVEKKIKRDIVT